MVAVSYYCPQCGAVAELERDPYLADKSVTPFPLEGWTYADPGDDFERDDWDGVRLVCGADVDGLAWSHPPSESAGTDDDVDGSADDPGDPESEYVRLSETEGPQSPSGPGGPGGPGFSR
jgi:hypothetical protein